MSASKQPRIKFIDLQGRVVMTQPASEELISGIRKANVIQPIALSIGDRSFAVDNSHPALFARQGVVVCREIDPDADVELIDPSELSA